MARKPAKVNKAGSALTHIDASGEARMVDVSDKAATAREAIAEGFVRMSAETAGVRPGQKDDEDARDRR